MGIELTLTTYQADILHSVYTLACELMLARYDTSSKLTSIHIYNTL